MYNRLCIVWLQESIGIQRRGVFVILAYVPIDDSTDDPDFLVRRSKGSDNAALRRILIEKLKKLVHQKSAHMDFAPYWLSLQITGRASPGFVKTIV